MSERLFEETESATPPEPEPEYREPVQRLIGRISLQPHEARTCREYLDGLDSPYTANDVREILVKYGMPLE